jgi:mycothiol synthase
MNASSPPLLWRSIYPGDAPALATIDIACRRADGDTPISDLPGDALRAAVSPQNCLCAVLAAGGLAAAAWVEERRRNDDEPIYHLGGRVHPDHRRRGLGNHLLAWSEERARQLAGSARLSLVITDEALTPGAHALFIQNGYRRIMLETMYVRSLTGDLPDAELPSGITLQPWNDASAADFYAAYRASFRDRPGFPDPPAQEWIEGYDSDDEFHPELSLLARADGEPVGFVTAGEMKNLGWINQIGVAPAWRRRGLAATLMLRALRGLRDAGLQEAGLHVHVNNPGAARLYEKLAFIPRLQRARYVKETTGTQPL